MLLPHECVSWNHGWEPGAFSITIKNYFAPLKIPGFWSEAGEGVLWAAQGQHCAFFPMYLVKGSDREIVVISLVSRD